MSASSTAHAGRRAANNDAAVAATDEQNWLRDKRHLNGGQ